MSRLHSFLHDSEQLPAQLPQVHLIAQCGTKACHYLGRFILATIEPAIHHLLHALAQGLEQCGNKQGGSS
jgi:hypothetical protein